ncbi:ECF transporter S component [Acidaminobacter sp. JC074]|uniref:ECF transporter S component n=1 Tax=Acidaminobacter sp. JC074 TaxID=2530199 RepID=UPI001F0EDB75|nr:ECF transporter S component [Acidaminobacter sp. JC074]MCH4888076.1 ECF transporter S component [Acidaminobacter sp. JC074]
MNLRKVILSSLFLALALVLPFLTGQIPTIGRLLLPMHIPVLICGLICGWQYGLTVGFIAPILRGLMFGMPPLMPVGISMAFELAVYGMVAGLAFKVFKEKYGFGSLTIYLSLMLSMLAGRVMWGSVRYILSQSFGIMFSWEMFLAGAFVTAIPGIILQLILIPVLVVSLKSEIMKLQEVRF